MTAQSHNLDRYRHNFLRQVVCELRFPTLLELGAQRPPAAFVSALRKEYPHLELGNEVALIIGGASTGGPAYAHIFRSSKQTWTVSLKQSTVTIETIAYTTYAQLKERVGRVVEAAAKVIDSDFFTRIGLRYVNVINAHNDPVRGWVNPELVQPLLSGVFGGVHEYAGRLHLAATDGGCLLQHGIQLKKPQPGEEAVPDYVLDIDAFRNDVPIGDVASALDAMHRQAFDVFDWCLGQEARQHLSSEKSK